MESIFFIVKAILIDFIKHKQKKYMRVCYQKYVILTMSAFKIVCFCCNLTTLLWYLQYDTQIKIYGIYFIFEIECCVYFYYKRNF